MRNPTLWPNFVDFTLGAFTTIERLQALVRLLGATVLMS